MSCVGTLQGLVLKMQGIVLRMRGIVLRMRENTGSTFLKDNHRAVKTSRTNHVFWSFAPAALCLFAVSFSKFRPDFGKMVGPDLKKPGCLKNQQKETIHCIVFLNSEACIPRYNLISKAFLKI